MGCSNPQFTTLNELELYPFNEENGILKSIDKDEIHLEVNYKPRDLVKQQLKQTSSEQYISDSLDYFILRVSKNNAQVENAYATDKSRLLNLINYFSSISDRIYLVTKTDTIPALDAVYAPTFGSTKSTQLMLVFDSYLSSQTGEVKLVFDDTFFGIGQSEFQFTIEDIKRIPRLKI